MEKCNWYGSLAGSGPQTQWLASVPRQWVTLLTLDKRQVGGATEMPEVIVFCSKRIRCRDQKNGDRVYTGSLQQKAERRQRKTMASFQHNSTKWLLWALSCKGCHKTLDSWTKAWAVKTRIHVQTQMSFPASTYVVPTKCGRSATEPFPVFPTKPHFNAPDLFHRS